MLSEYFIQAAIVLYLIWLAFPQVAQPPLAYATSFFLITNVFLLAFYCIFMVLLRALEQEIGVTHFLLLYFIGGVAGNIGLLTFPVGGGILPVSGAVAGVFALAGAFAARHPYEMSIADFAYPVPIPAIFAVGVMVVIHLVLNANFDVLPLIIGVVYGFALGERQKSRPLGQLGYYRR